MIQTVLYKIAYLIPVRSKNKIKKKKKLQVSTSCAFLSLHYFLKFSFRVSCIFIYVMLVI